MALLNSILDIFQSLFLSTVENKSISLNLFVFKNTSINRIAGGQGRKTNGFTSRIYEGGGVGSDRCE